MRKVTCAVLAIMLCLMGIAMAERSPTADSLYWCRPEMPFRIVKDINEWANIYERIDGIYSIEGFNEMVLGTTDYEFVECLIVSPEHTYNNVLWSMSVGFEPTSMISVFIISTNLQSGFVMNGIGTEDNNVYINFTGIAPGEYYMLVFIAD